MRVLQIETFGRGGLTHYVDNLSRALKKRGHDVTILTTCDYELDEQETPVEVVRRLAGRTARARQTSKKQHGLLASLGRKFEAIQDAFTAARFAARLQPDVVHLHCTNPVALLYLLLLRVASRKKFLVVATAHQVTLHEAIPLQAVVYRAVHRLSHLVIAHSQFDRRRLIDEFGVSEERIAVVPHGEYGFFEQVGRAPDRNLARRQLGLEPDDQVALFFGYLREYKGLDLLLEAWPAVAEANPRARLLVAGDPVQLPSQRRTELEEWANSLGAITRFAYIPLSEVSTWFSAADLLVMPYRKISQSGVLYLGLALGVPVLATRIGPWAELLTDGENALLVDPESPSALSQGLVRLLADADLRRRLAEGGRELAAEHSWPAIAEKTEQAFLSVMRN